MPFPVKGSLAVKKNITAEGNIQVGNSGLIKLADADSSNFINLKAPSTVTSDVTLTFPATVGTAGYALTTDGTSGILSWTAASGANPAGAGTELQYRVSGSTFGALTNSAVSSSNLSIGTTTATAAQLTVLSSGTSLPALKLQAAASTGPTISQLSIYDGAGSLKTNIKTDGSFSFPFLTYDVTNRTLNLATQGAPTTRGLIVGDNSSFQTNTQVDFYNPSQNIVCARDSSSSYTTTLAVVAEDSVGTTGITLSGAKIAGVGTHTSGTKTAVYGLEAYGRLTGAGGATTVGAGTFTVKNESSATITNLSTVIINSPNIVGGTITNNIGLDIRSQHLASSTCFSIKSLGGHAYFETGNANNKGITIRGVGSQASNLLTLEDNSGNPLFSFNGSGYASGQFLNSGLAIRDTDSSHKLSVVAGSNLTADRSLTLTTGDASRIATFDGDTQLAGRHQVFRTQDNSSGIEIQGSVLGAATQGTLFGSSGVIVIPANWFTVGSTISLDLRGHFITAASAGNYTFRVKLGSTVLAASAATAMTNSLGTPGDPFTGAAFDISIKLSCLTTGGTGGIDAIGFITYNSSGTTPVRIPMLNNGNTINTAISQNLDCTVEMSIGSANNYVDVFTVLVVGNKA